MSALSLFTFDEWNKLQIAGAQASALTAGVTLDFTVGSNPLALVEGATSAILYLQADIVVLLALTRANTSVDADLDTWMADFDFPRLPATVATGVVTLSRDQPGQRLVIPADGSARLVSADGTQTYSIVASVAQPTYDAGSNTYIVPAATLRANVSVVAAAPGVAGNVSTRAGLLLGSNVVGFDTATTAAGFADGGPVEPDDAFRARFVLFLDSLARGTLAAIRFAISSVQQGITFTIANNSDTLGNFEPGNFVVTVDDGSGNPTAALLYAVDAAVARYAANTISFNIRGPQVVYAAVGMTVNVTGGLDPTQVAQLLAGVRAAVAAYVNSLPLGAVLSLTRISAVVYAISANIGNVSFVTINGLAGDLAITASQVVKLNPVSGLNVALGNSV